jgi:hypothetical protein
LKAPSPLSLPPLLPHKLERKKSSFGGVIKGWFGGGAGGSISAAKGKKKELPADQRDRSSLVSGSDASPPTTPVDALTQQASTLGLSLPSSARPSVTSPPPVEVLSPAVAVAGPMLSRSRTSSASALPQMVRTPPSLTPLQSLHLLSAQKLSIMFRPSPHPLFLSRTALTGLAQRPLSLPGGPGSGRRFPASTNPLTRRNQQRHLGLAAEAGIRTVMRKLEEGMVASAEEIEALIQ